MSSNYIIRRAHHTDIPRLIELLKILFSIEKDFSVDESKQRKGLEMMLDDYANRCIIVAAMNQQIIGMCTAQILVSTSEGGSVALVEDLVVDKENRRKGIGRDLLLSLENWAIEKGTKRLQLLADRNNTPALEFYKSMSWNHTQLICLHKK
ncbi:MAG: GNAT family N-acetyltransferase [Desulfitobacteriaceae bacterium]|nr:GNAT family N-acetyltransferase [Desulfitobacteriaceae bacterium]MDI6915192.1 GNAT family N-acetyltransferase [Desulfitobacteriaceae bacterium]